MVYIGFMTGGKPVTSRKFAKAVKEAQLGKIEGSVVVITYDRTAPPWATSMVAKALKGASLVAECDRNHPKAACVVVDAWWDSPKKEGDWISNPDKSHVWRPRVSHSAHSGRP